MSDLYVHHPAPDGSGHYDNLLALARHLVRNAAAIEAAGGLRFGDTSMRRFRPLPAEIMPETPAPLPPLAHGPLAGVAAQPGDDWRTFCLRAFGVRFDQPFIHWLQGKGWATTEPSAIGAGLRIAYVLDYGIPHDHAAIAAGEAGTDYDTNGFLWDRLDMLPPGYAGGPLTPLRQWPSR